MNDSVNQGAESGQSVTNDIEDQKTYIAQARGAVEADSAAIRATKERFENDRILAETSYNSLNTALSALEASINEATKKYEEFKNLGSELAGIKSSAEQAKTDVDADIQAIKQSKIDFEELATDTQGKADELQAAQKGLETIINDIKQKHDSISALHTRLLEDTKNENGDITAESIQTAIAKLNSSIKAQFISSNQKIKEIESDFANLKSKLQDEIHSLLPGAGAAGLAFAYFDAKGRYGSTPYRSTNSGNQKWGKLWHIVCNALNGAFYYALFILPLVAIFYIFVPHDLFNVHDLSGQETLEKLSHLDPKIFFYRIVISAPLALISYFGFSTIRLNRRLYEEYNHKQRVMELYRSFKEQIDGEGTVEQKQALIHIMLSVVGSKPSLVMSEYENDLMGFLDSLKGKNSTIQPEDGAIPNATP